MVTPPSPPSEFLLSVFSFYPCFASYCEYHISSCMVMYYYGSCEQAGLPFSLRLSTRKVGDYCILEQITSSKAYLQTKSNMEWMDGPSIAFMKRTQASISTVTVGFAQNSNYGTFLFSHLISPLCVCKKFVPFSPSVSIKVIWWNT